MNKEDYNQLNYLLKMIPDDDLARAIGGLFGKEIEQNKRYRDLLESIRYTQDIAKEIQAEKPNIKVITPDDLLQHILRKVNKELEKTENA